MPADLHVTGAQLAWDDSVSPAGLRVLDPQQIDGQGGCEPVVDISNGGNGRDRAGQPTLIDPPLRGDVGFGLELKVTLLPIRTEIFRQRTLDIDGVRIVTLNEIA